MDRTSTGERPFPVDIEDGRRLGAETYQCGDPLIRRRTMTSSRWSTRLYEATDEVLWAIKLNLWWVLFTLAGGVVLGVGPATLAAYTLARRHALGDSFPVWPAFAAAFRREFRRGS